MKRLTQKELSAAHRIYNRVNDLTSNYYGKRTLDVVHKFVSENRWIMFPTFNITSLREGTTYPTPNVFICFEDEIKDNNTGQVEGWIGLTYNNSDSMLWLNEILRVKNAPFFMSILNNLDKEWIVNVQQKIKTNFKDNTPVYKTISSIPAPKITIDDIKNGIDKSNATLLKQGDTYNSEPVLWCVTVFSVTKETSVSTFDADVKGAFGLFFRVLSLR